MNAAVDRVFQEGPSFCDQAGKATPSIWNTVSPSRPACGKMGSWSPIVFHDAANKNDYGPAAGNQPHADLQPAFAAVQMTYFENLSRGIAHVGI